MSQNSPAKHERIERHLMRQRGAGTRTVNVEFGFSFAGFSAPSSSQTTPNSAPAANEPPMKRRRMTEDDQEQRELAGTSALDRREQTKARNKKKKKKKIFDIGGENELKRSERPSKENGDDSFVAGCNVKNKKTSKAKQTPVLARPDPIAPREEDAAREEENDGTIKHERTTRRRKGGVTPVDYVTSPRRVAAPAASHETVSRAKRQTKKSTPAAQQIAAKAAGVEVEEQPTLAKPSSRPAMKRNVEATVGRKSTKDERSVKAEVRPKKRSTRKAALQDAATNACGPASLSAEDVEPPVIGPQGRNRERARESIHDHGAGAELLASTATQSPKPTCRKQKAAPKRKKVDQRLTADAGRRDFASNDVAAERDDAVAPEGRKSDRAGEVATPKEQRARTTKRTLKSKANVLRDSHSEDENPTLYSRTKASQPASEVASEETKLQSTPPQLERRPLQQADANRSPARRWRAVGVGLLQKKLGDQVVKNAANAASRKRKRKATVDEKPVDAQRTRMPAEEKNIGQPEEEDIDWLFAAPESRFKAPSSRSTANEASSAPRKTKLADMDLDDLIANVAAFAQPGDATNRDVAGGPARKARGRYK